MTTRRFFEDHGSIAKYDTIVELSFRPFGSILPLLLALLVASACGRSQHTQTREFQLRGQILAVRADVSEVRIAHEAVPGLMDGMTMSFKVKDRAMLQGRQPGDMVEATLVVGDTESWLATLRKTGEKPLPVEQEEPSGPAVAFSLLEPGQPLPDATFTDTANHPWSPSSERGRAMAITFIYTRCPLPDYCPRMDRAFLEAQRLAATRGLADRVRFVTISFDPEFDTPDVLARHADSIGGDRRNWRFVTAPREVVDRFGGRLGLTVMRGDGPTVDITHNLRTAVVAPDGTLDTVLNGTDWTAATLVDRLAATLR